MDKFGTLLEKIEKLHDWNEIENESQDVTRFDFTHESGQPASMWIYKSGTKDGNVPIHIELDVKILLQEYNN